MPGHDQDRRVEERALGSDEPVGHPGPGDGAEVDQPAVGPDDPDGRVLGDPQSAVLDRVVQVEQQDALHAVEAEPLPELDAEQVGQYPRLAEEGPLVVLRLLDDVGHADHDGTGGARDGSTERVILRVSRPGVRTAVRTAGARTTARRCRRPRGGQQHHEHPPDPAGRATDDVPDEHADRRDERHPVDDRRDQRGAEDRRTPDDPLGARNQETQRRLLAFRLPLRETEHNAVDRTPGRGCDPPR